MEKACPGHGNSVPSQLSLQWFCKNSYSWAHNLRFTLLVLMNQKGAKQAKGRSVI